MIGKAARIVLRDARVTFTAASYRRGLGAPVAGRATPAPGTVAVVRPDRIGDFVLATPALAHLRAAFQNDHLCLVGNKAWSGLARWLNDHAIVEGAGSLFDEIEAFQPEQLVHRGYFNEWAGRLSRFATVVYFACSRTHALDQLMRVLPGTRVGCAGDCANITRLQNRRNLRGYDRVIPAPATALEYARNAAFVDDLTGRAPTPAAAPRWRVPEAVQHDLLEEVAARETLDLKRPFIVISPFTSSPIKDWPLKRYGVLIHGLRAAHKALSIVLLGAPGDQARAQTLEGEEAVLNLIGRVSLVESAALIRGARLSISADTAALHIASAVGTPCIGILGGGQYGRFYPYASPWETGENLAATHEMPCYDCNWLCWRRMLRRGGAPCIERIPERQVLDQAAGLLDRHRP